MKSAARNITNLVFLFVLTLMISCTEEMDSGSTVSSAPPPDQQPLSQTLQPSQSALGGAKRAAQGTRDKVADYQQKLLDDMEDN